MYIACVNVSYTIIATTYIHVQLVKDSANFDQLAIHPDNLICKESTTKKF